MADQILNADEKSSKESVPAAEPKKLEYSASQALSLIEKRKPRLSELKISYDKWWNAFKGKSWWAQDLPIYKATEVDNQIFPILQSIIGYLSKTQIRDRIIPPSDDPEAERISYELTNACTDFWRVNRRTSRIQDWLRSSIVKGDSYYFIRVEPEAYYPFLVDSLDPSEFIEASESIEFLQDQPWVARPIKTNVGYVKAFSKDKVLIKYFSDNFKTDDQEIILYDFWSKVGDGQNSLITEGGQPIYERPWPFKTKGGLITCNLYPFYQLKDISYPGSSRSMSSVEMVYQMQKLYDKQKAQIWENAEFMGNPPIVVDVESGIDTSKIEGKPRLIIKKYRDGDFKIVPVPPLPGYVERQPDATRESIQRNLGWNPLMEQGKAGSAREKGAVKALQLSGFATMDPKLKNLAQAIDDANNIFIGLLKHYEFAARKALSYRTGTPYLGFSPSDIKGIYYSRVRLDGADPEREQKRNIEIQTNFKIGLYSRRVALREMGDENVDAIIKDVYKDRAEELEFERQKAEYAERTAAAKMGKLPEAKLEGKPGELAPFPGEEKPVSIPEVKKPVSINYVDFLGNIIMSGFRSKLSGIQFYGQVEILEPTLGVINANQVKLFVPYEGDRVKIVEEVPDIAAKIIFTSYKNPHSGESMDGDKNKSSAKLEENVSEVKETEVRKSSETYVSRDAILAMIKKGIIQGTDLKAPDYKKYEGMTGLYLVEPHAEMVYTKQKKLILKGRAYPNMLNRDFILIGDKAYGIIKLIYGGKIKLNDVKALEKLHRVTEAEWTKWWGNKDLYTYAFVLKRFPEPIAYEKKAGVQTFQTDVKFILGKVEGPQASVVTGGIKVVDVKPGSFVPVAKPEKKAFTSNEVYSLDRLKEVLPVDKHSFWDVSFKCDGLRCQAHKIGKIVKYFSDEAKEINSSRLQSVTDEILKKFPYDVVLDGELMMYKGNVNLKHQAIAGYIHSQAEPTVDEKAGLRYIVFDLLYVRNSDISKKPFENRSKTLDLFLKDSDIGTVRRVKHSIVSSAEVPNAIKKNISEEGVVMRAADSSYFHTALMFKMKKMFDIDVKVIGKEITKSGAWVYHCVLADGTYVGQTYAQKFVKAESGDVIRINVEHLTLRPSGRLSWFAPKALSKKGLKEPAGPSTTTPGINRPDTIAQIKEIFLSQGGTEQEWNSWYPKFEEWKKNEMPKLISKIKKV